MSDIMDAMDAAQAGYFTFEEFLQEFEAAWNQPLLDLAAAQDAQKIIAVWRGMPPAMKEKMQQANPEAYSQTEAIIKEMMKDETPIPPMPNRRVVAGRMQRQSQYKRSRQP